MEIVNNILLREVTGNKTPSLQYVIFNKDQIIHRFLHGLADIKEQKRTDEQTTYHAFSVTKTFTALAFLQLAERGRLSIDDPAKLYLPDFPYKSNITISQLLAHTAGIPNPIPLSWIHLVEDHQTFNRKSFFNQIFEKHNKIKSGPNEKYSYSNLGYILLGRIIENISGQQYEDYIDNNIIKPLDVRPGKLGFKIFDESDHAKGYHKQMSFSNLILRFFIDKSKFMGETEDKWKPFKRYYVNGAPYGGLIGTVDAFVKYIQELLKPDCKLIGEDYKKMLFTENLTHSNKSTGMCLSWFTGQLKGNQYFSHAGGGGGYYCEIRVYPQLGIGSVIMFNRTGMSDQRFLDKVDQLYITHVPSPPQK